MHNLHDIIKLSNADACIVTRYREVTENLRWANTSTTTNGSTVDEDIFIVSIIKKSVGVVTASFTDSLDIEELLRRSEELARKNPPSDDYFDLTDASPELQNKKMIDTKIDVIIKPLESVFTDAKNTGIDIFGYAELKTTEIETVNSKGLHKEFKGRSGQIELNAKNKERTSSIWRGQSINAWEDQKILDLYKDIVQKLEWSKTKIEVDPGKHTVVLEPSAFTDLLVYAYWESASRDADEGRTVFSTITDKDGLLNKGVTIYSDPHEPGYEYSDFVTTASSSSHESVFDNGAKIEKFDWISKGTIKNLFAPRYYAKKSKRSPVYFGENLIFDSDGVSTSELIEGVEDGLLVTCFWYIREVDSQTLLLTGLTRDGVFVIKNGKIIGAASNFRFNMSPITVLKNITKIGKSERTLAREFGDYFKQTKIPPVVVDNFNMSTKSDAL